MEAVILCGGQGTRLREETEFKPKPMVEIGGKPILWHIMKIYSAHAINDFILCLGYKGYVIKEYFANYFLHMSDVTFDMAGNKMEVHQNSAEPWKVTLVDTGENTMTGGRLKRVRQYLGNEAFCMTYGDGVADVDIAKLVAFHKRQGRLATLTAIQPPGRFGTINMDKQEIVSFEEKPHGSHGWINGGYFVLDPAVIDYIEGDHTVWERDTLERLAREGRLAAFLHTGFWHCMDNLRDKNYLDEVWNSGHVPWKVWT
jgi:glucose-1-phosphate cytidylyltransferase